MHSSQSQHMGGKVWITDIIVITEQTKIQPQGTIVLVTKYRKQLLKGAIADDVKQKIFDICNSYG